MPSRIIVVQPECKSRIGHPYAAIKSLEKAIAPARPVICIHRQASRSLDLAEDRTIRQFSGRIAGAVAAPGDAPVPTPGVRELATLVKDLAIGHKDHLVFLSATAETALAVVQVFQDREPEHWPHCHLRFIGDERRPDLEISAHRILSDIRSRSQKLHLYAEFVANVRHILELYDDNPFEEARLPTLWPDQSAPRCRQTRDEHFTIGVFGPPRRDKGKYHLGPIFAELLAQADAANAQIPFKMLVQNDKSVHRAFHLRVSLAAKLQREMGRVTFAPAEMSNPDFVSYMRRCDVVLLPYIRDTYVRRGSGIVVDAVAHGVPFVCTSGTAMCELLDAGNGLAASSDGEFAQCLLSIAADPDQYKAAARASADRARGWWSNTLLSALRKTPVSA